MPKRLSKEDVIDKFYEIHKDLYDYSKVEYVNSTTKITIICDKHGDFEQTPASHIHQKAGCQKCAAECIGKKNRSSQKDFIVQSNRIHNGAYDYDKVEYISSGLPVTITCKIHGDFDQIASNHLHHMKGCSKCRDIKNAEMRILGSAEFINRSTQIFGDIYDYSTLAYVNTKTEVDIICKKHGIFSQTVGNHLAGKIGCTKCSKSGTSNTELEIANYVKSIVDCEVMTNSKDIIPPLELDIVIPTKNVAIELNGIYWHGEQRGKGKYYHLDKTKKCNKLGYRLIHILESEYVNNPELVRSRLSCILNASNIIKYGARKLNVKIPIKSEVRIFLNRNHIQGYCASSIEYGLYDEFDKLIALMTFGKSRYSKKHEYELLRFCSAMNTTVAGGASKLFSYFKKTHQPSSVISYSDIRWNLGSLYINLGFSEIRRSAPNYFYFSKPNIYDLKSRIHFQKHKLSEKLDVFDPNNSEWENMQRNGYDRIWDCGNIVYEWLT